VLDRTGAARIGPVAPHLLLVHVNRLDHVTLKARCRPPWPWPQYALGSFPSQSRMEDCYRAT
jgi:hypothetical protein